MSGQEKFHEGDDICKSCTGLLVFTSERKKRGLRPLCVGVPGVAKGRVPKDRLTELNQRTNGKLGTYVCFGYSQWTGMMERTGRVPLCISGIHLNIVSRYAPKKVTDDAQKGEQSGNITENNSKIAVAGSAPSATKSGDEKQVKHSSPIPGIFGAPRHHPNAPSSSMTSASSKAGVENRKVHTYAGDDTPSDTRLQLESAASEFTRLMRKGVVLQYRRMQDFYRNITTDPAKKVYNSAEKIGQSSAKVAGMLQKFWAEKWGD